MEQEKAGIFKNLFLFYFLNHLMEHVTGWYPMLLLELWNTCFIHDLPDFFFFVCVYFDLFFKVMGKFCE